MIKKKAIAALMTAAVLTVPFFTANEKYVPVHTVSAADTAANANSGSCGEKVSWTFSSGTLTISGSGDMKDFDYTDRCIADPPINTPWYNKRDLIKKVVITGRVTSVGEHSFEKCKNLESVSLPDSIEKIGVYAFNSCSELKAFNIPRKLDTIEDYAFSYCKSLEKVTIPGNIRTIRLHAFEGCEKLSKLVIEEGVAEILNSAFGSCDSLTSVDIPASVENFTYAFSNDKNMKNINVSKDNAYWTSVDGVVFSKDMTKIWEYPLGKTARSYTVPEGVKFIACNTFSRNTTLEDIKLPESLTYLNGCFSDMSALKNVTVPQNIMSIGRSAFFKCEDLESVTILNPGCDIYDDECTFTNYVEWIDCAGYDRFVGTIIGYEGSTAQTFAQKHGYKFKSLGKYKEDSSLKRDIYNFTMDYLGGRVYYISDKALSELDVNSDGRVNVFDLLIMKRNMMKK